jgi:hypothetical protein
MTPEEIAAVFVMAMSNFSLLVGQPSDEEINALELAIKPVLHDINYDMFGPHNLVGLIKPTITYTATWGQAFVRPVRPTPYDLTIDAAATPVVCNRMEAIHNLLLQEYATFIAAEKGASKFIRDSVDETYYKDLEHPTTFYNSATAEELLLHLRTNCGGREPEDLIALQTSMNSYCIECDGIPEYIIKLKKA